MKKIVFNEGSYEDTLSIDDEYIGRIDNLTLSELLCLLARNKVIDLEIKTVN
jgi:hypothetical protein